MPRTPETIIGADAYARGGSMPMTNLEIGGQFGHEANYPDYVSDTPHIPMPMFARVIETPRAFRDMDNPARWTAAYVALIERHARQIQGMDATLTVESREVPFGAAGEMIEAPAKMGRNRSNPSFTWIDRYGRPITHYWNNYGLEIIGDPETQVPNVATRTEVDDFLLDYIGGTVLFVIPDRTFRKVDNAFLSTAFWPKTFPELKGSRDVTVGADVQEINMDFAAVTQHGVGVNMFAKEILSTMSVTGTNPQYRRAFVNEITADTLATNQTYRDELEKLKKQAVLLP